MASASNTLAIIIVNYKSLKVLRNCLNSVSEIIIDDTEIETIVVDNASNDGEITTFQNDFPLISFLENTGNNGFSNACNLGAKTAKGTYLLFLNPDTILNKDALSEMLTYYQKHKNCGIVSCLLRNVNGYEKTKRFFPKFNTLFGVLRSINKHRLDQHIIAKENVISVDWVSGALVFISKNWLEKINFWNEDYWMYFEDMDLCKRARNLNLKISLLNNWKCIHYHGGSSRRNKEILIKTKVEVIKSSHIYVDTHIPYFKSILIHFLMIFFKSIELIILTPFSSIKREIFKQCISYWKKSIIAGRWIEKK